MVICVYLNPTIDKTIYLDKLTIGATNRPNKVITEGAGKGVNVAAVLKELSADVLLMGFLYSSDGNIIQEKLTARKIDGDFCTIPGVSRTNTKIFDSEEGVITEINESGEEISIELLEQEAKSVYARAQSGDIVVLTGSLPPGCPKDFYARMIFELNKKGALCVLDADGEALLAGVEEKPYFIKPNIDEISVITGDKPGTNAEVIEVCRKIISKGVSQIAVSMGGDGAIIANANEAYFARPMRVNVLSTVGAGDSMVAGTVAHFDKPLDIQLRAGVAAATASITLEGTNLCTKELYQEYYEKIIIESL